MATIRASLALYDGVTSPLASMNRAMHIVLNSFEALQNASSNAIDTASIQQARDELARAEVAFNSIENEIRQADTQQQRLNRDIRDGSSAAEGLQSAFKRIAGAVIGIEGVKKALGLSDEYTNTTARLNLIVDDGGSLDELEQKIMASAQRSRSAYMDVANSVSSLAQNAGAAFNHNNDEIIAFMEQVNKQFVIGGASAQEISATMTQLTQAMGAGALRGDELNSVLEQAPGIARAIESYMGVAEGSIKQYAEQGAITAEVVKNALFAAADETNKKFEEMPMTWAQIWTSMQNKALSIFSPILQKLNELANSERFQTMVDGLLNGLAAIAGAAYVVLNVISAIAAFFVDNWSIISPIIYGIVGALAAYALYLGITKGLELASAAAKTVMCLAAYAHAAATGAEVSATVAQTAAQLGLNSALYACPLTWILIAIIAIIAVIYAVIHAINKFANKSISATGVIVGAFTTAGAAIGNIIIAAYNVVVNVFVSIYNLVATVANFLATVLNDPISAIVHLFQGLADTVLGILKGIASAIDAIFGSNLAGAVSGWQSKLSGWVDKKFGAETTVINKLNASDYTLDHISYQSAFKKGYSVGGGVADKVGSLFDSKSSDPLGALGLSDVADSLGSYNTGNTLGDIGNSTADTAANTAAMRDSMSTSENELKYLREIAEREAINRFTTAELNITMNNTNTISGTDDIDGIITALEVRAQEAMIEVSEGAHI